MGRKVKVFSFLIVFSIMTGLFQNGTGPQSVAADSEISSFAPRAVTDTRPVAEAEVIASDEPAHQLQKDSRAEFTVMIPENALYTAEIFFSLVEEQRESFTWSLQIDGAYPFAESEILTAYALWEDAGEVRTLTNGDQSAPAQQHVDGFVSSFAADKTGVQTGPYEIFFTAGKHTVTVTALDNPFLLSGIRLGIPERLKPYSKVSAEYKASNYSGKQLVLEAEKPLYRNTYALTAKADNASANISPKSYNKSLLNYIGANTWKSANQEITWHIDAPEDGLYKLGFSYKQNGLVGGKSYRWLKIDGKTPFEEASKIGFTYDTKWKFKSFADENGDEYLFYLKKGEHTLSLAVTLADAAEVFERLEKIVASIGETYLDMVMITGEAPDINRDYELHKQIPGFEKSLKSIYKQLNSLSGDIGSRLELNGEINGSLKNMARVLRSMFDNLYDAHLQIPTYFSVYQTLSAWLYDITNMPLSLDQIILAAPNKAFDTPRASFFSGFWFSVRRFFSSFGKTRNTVVSGNNPDDPTIKIWVNWGRDQVKVLNSLIQESFTKEHDVNVRIEQVNASLVQGVVSGTSPDLYLYLKRTEPVNLAMRGVLNDLKSFADFEQVLGSFQPGAEIPYQYKNGCYALPDTQSFFTMFYRTDILERLGITPPETWDDFILATGVLQRNNMNSYLPYVKIKSADTVDTGAGGLSIFPTMLLQHGGEIYKDNLSGTNLASAESVKAFTLWTDFYTRFSLDADANFTQRFRVGTIPLGIAGYGNYMTFAAGAPEIEGKWAMSQLPGVMKEDGTVNNLSSGSGTGCGIMKSSKNKDAAWEFLKWWTSAEIQYRYSAETEAILGPSGRTSTSNIEALSRLSWDADALAVLQSQWKNVLEIPEVPGSYYVARSIDQAFWAVKNGKSDNKETITEWAEISDKEISRKLKEYKFEK